MSTLLALLACCIPVAALWAATAMPRRMPFVPVITDPGAEARAALTAPQPVPTGRHRKPWEMFR